MHERTQGTRSLGPVVRTLVAVCVWLCLSSVAHGDESANKASCVQAAEQGQQLQQQGKLRDAVKEFHRCSQPFCPDVVIDDCTRFAAAVERSLPSVVFRARDGKGRDIVDVVVTIDGVVATNRLEGRAVSLDPGVHSVEFATKGHATISQQLVAVEGEKLRSVEVAFDPPASPTSPSASVKPSPSKRPEPPSGPPTISWILGGLGLACLGGFTYLGLSARSEHGELEDTCGKTHSCSDDQVDSFQRQAIAADILLGVGLASLSSAGVIWALSNGETEQSERALLLVPRPSGGSLQVLQRF